jgi:hypothetical protein
LCQCEACTGGTRGADIAPRTVTFLQSSMRRMEDTS